MATKSTRELIAANLFGYAVYLVLAALLFPHMKEGLKIIIELGIALVAIDLARALFASLLRKRDRDAQRHLSN